MTRNPIELHTSVVPTALGFYLVGWINTMKTNESPEPAESAPPNRTCA